MALVVLAIIGLALVAVGYCAAWALAAERSAREAHAEAVKMLTDQQGPYRDLHAAYVAAVLEAQESGKAVAELAFLRGQWLEYSAALDEMKVTIGAAHDRAVARMRAAKAQLDAYVGHSVRIQAPVSHLRAVGEEKQVANG